MIYILNESQLLEIAEQQILFDYKKLASDKYELQAFANEEAKEQEKPMGRLFFSVIDDYIQLWTAEINDQYQGEGLGTMLYNFLVNNIHDFGVSKLKSDWLINSPQIHRIWEKLGAEFDEDEGKWVLDVN